MNTSPVTLVKSHLNTTNMYVQKQIFVENIKAIHNWQLSTTRENVSNDLWFEISGLKKKQISLLDKVNKKILQYEVLTFHFGNSYL